MWLLCVVSPDNTINMKSQHFWLLSLGLYLMLIVGNAWHHKWLYSPLCPYALQGKLLNAQLVAGSILGKIPTTTPNPVILVISPWSIHIVVFLVMTQWAVVWQDSTEPSLAARTTSDRDLTARFESTTVNNPPTDLVVWALRAGLILPALTGRWTRDRRVVG